MYIIYIWEVKKRVMRIWGGGEGGWIGSEIKFCVFLPSKPQERREHIVNTFYDAVPPLALPSLP